MGLSDYLAQKYQRHSRAEILRLPECGKFELEASIHRRDKVLNGTQLAFYKSMTYKECLLACVRHPLCKSINYNAKIACQIISQDTRNPNAALMDKEGWTYIETAVDSPNIGMLCREKKPCINGGKCKDICWDPGYECKCAGKFTGQRCQIFTDWGVSLRKGSTLESVYPNLVIPTRYLPGLTMCAWFRVSRSQVTLLANIHLYSERVLEASLCNCLLIVVQNNQIIIQSKTSNVIAAAPYSTEEWNHLCVAMSLYNPLLYSFQLYLQGKLLKNTTFSTGWYAPTKLYRIMIGNDVDEDNGRCIPNDPSQGFLGNISQVNIWDFQLNKTDIEDVYRFRLGVFSRVLLGWEAFANSFNRSEIVTIFDFLQDTDAND